MNTLIKIIAIFIIIILIASSIFAVFFLDGDSDDKGDTTPPKIDDITRDTTGTTGKITSISVSFSDNVEVTEAIIHYKSENADTWSEASILSGNFDIKIPPESDDDWFYFVTVDDAAGNGPVGDPSTEGTIYYTITVTKDIEDLTHTMVDFQLVLQPNIMLFQNKSIELNGKMLRLFFYVRGVTSNCIKCLPIFS